VNVLALIEAGAQQLTQAGVAFGHGTTNAFDEAAWLVLWKLGLPLDDLDGVASGLSTGQEQAVNALLEERIATRKPAAYLTQEAWLQGVPFYVDERAIVPRSFIAELLADPDLATAWTAGWPPTPAACWTCAPATAAWPCWPPWSTPTWHVDAADISGRRAGRGPHQCGPPWPAGPHHADPVRWPGRRGRPLRPDPVQPALRQRASMAALPAEYLAEPDLALAGGADGMDFVRQLLQDAPRT
jgi:ribosomal protein L3 glutamine methyltransferase